MAVYQGPVILPKHVWETLDPFSNGQLTGDEPVIGSGPFIFEEWVSESHVSMVANENYWDGRPYLDKVVWRFIPSPTSAIAAMQTGEVHGGFSLPFDAVATLAQQGVLVSAPWTATTIVNFQFNLRRPLFQTSEYGKLLPTLWIVKN
jgi:peptide/nickel transport system substrate-binding protein